MMRIWISILLRKNWLRIHIEIQKVSAFLSWSRCLTEKSEASCRACSDIKRTHVALSRTCCVYLKTIGQFLNTQDKQSDCWIPSVSLCDSFTWVVKKDSDKWIILFSLILFRICQTAVVFELNCFVQRERQKRDARRTGCESGIGKTWTK